MTRTCQDCGIQITGKKRFCNECRNKRLKRNSQKYMKKYMKNHNVGLSVTKDSCEDILKNHHERLKHDPERLSTKFIADVAGCSCRIVKKKVAK